jgi:membrane protease subunit (stomatin/prohibitin family)
MTDINICELITTLQKEIAHHFILHYVSPIVSGSGHALEIESTNCLGTISIWAAGSMDWHIFDTETSVEAILGYLEVNDVEKLRTAILAIFSEIRDLDEIKLRTDPLR